MERQLVDHLDGGKYSKNPDQQLLQNTCHAKITNIPAENLFGELDCNQKKEKCFTFSPLKHNNVKKK